MYDLILFDLDGTLLDSDQMLVETFHELYRKHRPDYHPSLEHILSFSGPQISETLKKEFPDGDQVKLLKEFREISSKNYVKCSKLYPGVDELIKELNRRHVKFGVVTNKHRYATNYTYKLFKVDEQIPFTVCADEVEHLKPSGDGILISMKHFGVTDKSKVLYVGDGQIDYLTAKNAGVKFAYVDWSIRKLEDNAKVDIHIQNYQQFLEEII